MTFKGLWHVSWTVESMDKALEFYVGLLGMEIVHEQLQDNAYTRELVGVPGAKLRVVMLTFPGVNAGISGHLIELVEYIEPKGVKLDLRPCNIGAAHCALITDDAWELYERLSAGGIDYVSPPVAITAGMNKGGFTCYVRAPDGFTLEFMQPPAWRLEGKPAPQD